MEALQLLEQKISSLVELARSLKSKNEHFQKDLEQIARENAVLKSENAKLAKENAQLGDKLQAIEKSTLKGNNQIDELNQEKALTKVAVDDLLERLKVIDSIVEQS